MKRREFGFLLGLVGGLWVSRIEIGRLVGSPAWQSLRDKAPSSASFVRAFVGLPFPLTFAIMGLSLVRLTEVQNWLRPEKPARKPLPPYPFDPKKTQLILGEVHQQDGSRCDEPRWMIQPRKGMYGSMLVTGATGSSKTQGTRPYLKQLIWLHADDPERKLGGFVIDSKGRDADFVREECEKAGRAGDYFEIGLRSGLRCNPLLRPDLTAPALGGLVGEMIANVQGEAGAEGPFWRDQARDLATYVMWLIRLAEGREPTLADLYQIATSPGHFESWMTQAEQRARAGKAPFEEVEAVRFWYQAKIVGLDEKLRTSIAAGLNGVLSMFVVPEIRKAFCAGPGEEHFRNFDDAIEKGQICVLRVPHEELKTVAEVVGTLMKLNWFGAVLNRLPRADGVEVPGRDVFFFVDEYDVVLSMPADGTYLSKSREAKAVNLLLTQSWESIVGKVKNEHVAGILFSNCRTKLWLTAADNFTARQAADLCGEVDRPKESLNRSETVRNAAFSYADGKIIGADPAEVGESRTISLHREHLFPPRCFTRLQVNQAIVMMFDGIKVHEPTYLYLKAAHHNPNVSWFDIPERDGGGAPDDLV